MGEVKKSENKIQDRQYQLEPVQTNDEELQRKKYYKVDFSEIDFATGQLLNVGLNQGRELLTFSELAKKAPNGLFTASTSVDNLTQFKDGSYSTMVRGDNGQIQKHAGFVEVKGVGGVNLAKLVSVGMQAMSIASGMYYLHEINTQLNSLNEKVNEIIRVRDDEQMGMLKSINKIIIEISNKEEVSDLDLAQLRRQREKASEIFEARFETYNRRRKENLNTLKKIEKSILEINKDTYLLYQANRLELSAQLIEIFLYMKNNFSESYIKQQLKQFKSNYNNSFLSTLPEEILVDRDRISSIFAKEITLVRSKNKHFKIDHKIPWFKGNPFEEIADVAVRGYEKIRINKLLKEKEKIVSKQNQQSEGYRLLNEKENFGEVIQSLELPQIRGEVLLIKNSKDEVQELYVPMQA
jgi:hypothetical protein